MRLRRTKMIIGSILIFLIIVILMNYKFEIASRDINDTTLFIIEIVVALMTILFIFISLYIWNKKNFSPEKALLCVVPVFCIILSAVMPVGRGHDEYAHWLKSYEVSQGILFTKIYNKVALVDVPKDALNIIVERTGDVFKYVDNLSMLDVKINENIRILKNNKNAATYCFIQYIPQAIGIYIGRLITKVPLLISYFGRTFNILICVALMYFAIKTIPFGKNILLALSIIPITIEGFSTLSSDGITIAIVCFFIAYVFKMIFDEKQECGLKQSIILTITGAILASCKFVYLPIVFLALLIPKEKFKNKKWRIMVITIIISVAVILNLIWLYYGSKTLMTISTEATNTKLLEIIANPLLYLKKVVYTFEQNFNNYFLSIFGGQLEWAEKVEMNVVPYVILALIGVATISETKLKSVFNKKQVILMLLIIFVISGLIFTSIFLQWTEDTVEINGVQGRYFIPILPLILFLLGCLKIQTSYQPENITKVICIVGYVIMIYTAISIMAIHI